MKKNMFFVALAAVALLATGCAKNADKVDEGAKEAQVAAQKVEINAIQVAGDLAQYGYEVSDPYALVKAADILASTPTRDLDAEYTAGEETANEGEKSNHGALDANVLIANAKSMAPEDELLAALIANVEAKLNAEDDATRGATGGAQYNCTSVYAHSTDTYNIRFNPGYAEIAVVGDGDTDLDLYVYDSYGNCVKDDSYNRNCYVSFNVSVGGNFTVRVVNRGGVYNNYCIATN